MMENENLNAEVIYADDDVTAWEMKPETEMSEVLDEDSGTVDGLAIAIGAAAVIGVLSLGRLAFKHVIKPIAGKIKAKVVKGKSTKSNSEDAIDAEYEDIEDDDTNDEEN